MSDNKQFTPADVASHNNADNGLYIIIDSGVYDVTNFIDEHPGGAKILKRVAGKDATKQFWKVSSFSCSLFNTYWRGIVWLITFLNSALQYHNESVLKKYTPKLKIGEVKDAAKL